jgi:hypothetical protein
MQQRQYQPATIMIGLERRWQVKAAQLILLLDAYEAKGCAQVPAVVHAGIETSNTGGQFSGGLGRSDSSNLQQGSK